MKIAFIGQKGIPAKWGGVESHVDELAQRLAQRGHTVSVYVRSWYTPKDTTQYHGVRLIHTPTWNTKHLDAFIHSFISTCHALFQDYDIVHYHALGPSFFCWIPKLFGKKVVVTIHRFDYLAAKWSWLAQMSLRFSEKIALQVPHQTIVVAQHQLKYYREKRYSNLVYIPNGVSVLPNIPPQIIKNKYGLQRNQYLLFAGRLTPEKRVDWIIDTYRNLVQNNKNSVKLVIAGGSSATDKYETQLHESASSISGIMFTGYVTGKEKQELFSNAKLFILPSAVEGLPIALLEGMSFGIPCLVSDIPPHQEVIQDKINGYLFDSDSRISLESKLEHLLDLPQETLIQVGIEAKKKVEQDYDWEDIVTQIEQIYAQLSG